MRNKYPTNTKQMSIKQMKTKTKLVFGFIKRD